MKEGYYALNFCYNKLKFVIAQVFKFLFELSNFSSFKIKLDY